MRQILVGVCLAAFALPSACDEVARSSDNPCKGPDCVASTKKSFRQPAPDGKSHSQILTNSKSCVRYGCEDEYVRWRDCQCNRDCFKNQNCCYDYEQQCKGAKSAAAPVLGALPKALAINKTTSLRGATSAKWGSCGEFTCAETYVSWRPCQCNSLCKDYGNCCSDYQAVCLSPPAPAIPGPAPQPPAVTPDLPDTSGPSAPIASVPVETTPPAPANVYAVNVTALPWTWKDGLNSPSEFPFADFLHVPCSVGRSVPSFEHQPRQPAGRLVVPPPRGRDSSTPQVPNFANSALQGADACNCTTSAAWDALRSAPGL